MDIQVISSNCAKVVLTKNEAEELNIDFEHFNKDDPETKIFLTYIISVLNDINIIRSKKDKISVEIYEQENQDLIIYISAFSEEKNPYETSHEFAFVTQSPQALIDFCRTSRLFYPQKVRDKNLYTYKGNYYLIFESSLSKERLIKTFSTYDIYPANKIKIEKAKEYGKILCHTPFDIICKLSSD